MRNPHEKALQGDHMAITFKGNPMTLDEIVIELNKLYEVSDIVDAAPELNMSNYDEAQVSELNQAMIDIHNVIYGGKPAIPEGQ